MSKTYTKEELVSLSEQLQVLADMASEQGHEMGAVMNFCKDVSLIERHRGTLQFTMSTVNLTRFELALNMVKDKPNGSILTRMPVNFSPWLDWGFEPEPIQKTEPALEVAYVEGHNMIAAYQKVCDLHEEVVRNLGSHNLRFADVRTDELYVDHSFIIDKRKRDSENERYGIY